MRGPVADERGFTLIEVMLAIVLLTMGLLAVADVFPQGLALGRYGKDQTTAAGLAQQEIECLKSQSTSALGGFVGDYGNARTPAPTVCNPSSTATVTSYFDQYGTGTTQTGAYVTRDVQVQYWTWSNSANAFTLPANPYVAPASGTPYVYRISAATHWLAKGQTAFTSGNTTSPNGCVSQSAQVPTGLGCVQASTFISP